MCNLWKKYNANGKGLFINLYAPIAGNFVQGRLSYLEFRVLLIILRSQFRDRGFTHAMKLGDFKKFIPSASSTVSKCINKLLLEEKIIREKKSTYCFRYKVNVGVFDVFGADDYLWKRYSKTGIELGIKLYHEIAYAIIKKDINGHKARIIVLVLALTDFLRIEFTPPQTLKRLACSTNINVSDVSKALVSLEGDGQIQKKIEKGLSKYQVNKDAFYCPENEGWDISNVYKEINKEILGKKHTDCFITA